MAVGIVGVEVVILPIRLTDRHVPDLLEAGVDRVGLPDLHAGPKDRVQRVAGTRQAVLVLISHGDGDLRAALVGAAGCGLRIRGRRETSVRHCENRL